MKVKLLFFYLFLVIGSSSIHAQESAFEVLLPYEVEFGRSFCWETADGDFIVNPGNNMLVKMSQEGEIVDEIAYTIESEHNTLTHICWTLDIPGDPTHHYVVAELVDFDAKCINILHIFKLGDDLQYDPDEVIVIDLSEEIKEWAFLLPHACVLEQDGSFLLASNVARWDGTYNLTFVRVFPDGQTIIHFNDHFSDYGYIQICQLVPENDHYNMMIGYHENYRDCLSNYEVSRDFDLNFVYLFSNGNSTTTPLQYDNLGDSLCVASWRPGDFCVAERLSDSVFLLPTEINGWNHFSTNTKYGAGIWKLDSNFNILDYVFFDVYDTPVEQVYKELIVRTPIVINNDKLYFCYTTNSGYSSHPQQIVIAKLDTNLNIIWKRWYGGDSGQHEVTDLVLTRDGGCLAVGRAQPDLSNNNDYPYVLKITSEGYCSVKENEELLLKPYCFFPNPVDDQLHMEFSPDVQPQAVEIYDVQGRLVGTQNTSLENVDMNGLPAGTYTLRIVMEDGAAYSEKVVKQ